jgi:hypothetical protein
MGSFSQNDTLIFKPIINQVLQQCEIRKINIARDGKLWLSTNKGVASFDGNDVHFFGHIEGDISSMWTSSISFLKPYEDGKGNLYVVNVSGPTYYFNTRTGKVGTQLDISVPNWQNFVPEPYSDIYIENDTSLWFARYDNGFLHYNSSSKQTTVYSLISNDNRSRNRIVSIRKDIEDHNLLWLATNNGIYSFQTKTEKLKRYFRSANKQDSVSSDPEILSMDVLNADTIWFTTLKRGVGFYNIRTGTYKIFPYSQYNSVKSEETIDIKFLQKKNKDQYYIVCGTKVPGIFNIRTHQYRFNSKIINNFPTLNIQGFVADSLGNCWCLIFGQLFYAAHSNNHFTTISPVNRNLKKDQDVIFKTIIWDKKRQCYYAAFDRSNEIAVFDKDLKLIKSIQGPYKPGVNNASAITDIGQDNNGHLWMSGDILAMYDSTKMQMVPVDYLFPNMRFPEQKFQNLVFRGNYLYTIPSNPSCTSVYRINTDRFTCDSIPLPEAMLDEQGNNQLGVIEIDSKSKYAYLSNKRSLYQINLITGELKLVKGLGFTTKTFNFFSNFHWYEIDDNDNFWVSSNGTIRVYTPDDLKVIRKIRKDKESYLLQSANLTGHSIMGFANSTGIELLDYKNGKTFKLSLSDGLITYTNSGVACANNILFVGAELNALQYISLNTVLDQHLKRSCYLSKIQLFNQPYTTDTLPEYLHSLQLQHNKNSLTLTFSTTEFEQPERLEYRYKLDGIDRDWIYVGYLNRTISYTNLNPENYVFEASVKNADGSWSDNAVYLPITILHAWWQTTGFRILVALVSIAFIYAIVRWRINAIRREEQQKSKHEKELLELEAKALRAQMNPHFIFNCLNSIKALIQEKEEDKAITYLTTFSKLIRIVFNNSDKREISLFDEIETCKLYTQLESMRFENKFEYAFCIDEPVDLKSILVPALIIQPFIENAIWHGLMPKGSGGKLSISVKNESEVVCCLIDDDGIGRQMSKQNKFKAGTSTHNSKGMHLTQNRIDLDNLINNRNASLEIIDKKNEAGNATGTTVILTFKKY